MRIFAAAALVLAFVAAPPVAAHAFPSNSSPHAGQVLNASPTQVRITFDGELEPVFSTLLVKNASGTLVSAGKGEVAASNHALLQTAIPTPLLAGKYEVYWSVIAHDGHHTEGHFPFTVQ
ncbi:MAG: copper resistance protein CopC [Rhodanobacter sp.]